MEAGRYNARVIKHGITETKNGVPQYFAQLEVTDGPAKGEAITWYGGLEGEGAQYTAKDLRTMGWKGDDITNVGDLDAHVRIKVEEGTNGYLRVRYIDPIDGGGKGGPTAKAPAANKLAAIRANFARIAKGTPAGGGSAGSSQRTPAQRPAPQPPADFGAGAPDDDTIPF